MQWPRAQVAWVYKAIVCMQWAHALALHLVQNIVLIVVTWH